MGTFDGVELTDLVLTGPRLTLRPWLASDADDVYLAMQDELAHRFLPLPYPYTREDATTFVTSLGDEGRAAGTGLGCALVDTLSGRLVGSAALRLPGEIGYAVYPWGRGHGFAAEATRVLTAWAFEHGVPRMQLFCDVHNLASVRTALAAGFSFEGVSRSVSVSPIDPGAGGLRADMARFSRVLADSGEPVQPLLPQLPRDGLADGVLALRVLVPGDVEAMMQTDDALTLQWAFSPEPHTLERAQRAADEAGLDWLVGKIGGIALVDLDSGRFAGSVRLRMVGPPGVCAVGYVVHPDFRGRGYTTRALRLLSEWAFDAGINRLELGAKIGNIASQKAATHAGFAYEGVFASRLRNADGSYSDEARYALVKPSALIKPAG